VLYKKLAEESGIPPTNVLIGDLGSVMEFAPGFGKITGKVTAGDVLVDGITVGEIGEVVLRDRRLLSKDGFLIVVVTVDKQTGEIIAGPDLVSRGFVYARDSEELLDGARDRAASAIIGDGASLAEPGFIQAKIKDAVGKYLYEQTRRRPMILPVVQEV
jgi:ribonuclease J